MLDRAGCSPHATFLEEKPQQTVHHCAEFIEEIRITSAALERAPSCSCLGDGSSGTLGNTFGGVLLAEALIRTQLSDGLSNEVDVVLRPLSEREREMAQGEALRARTIRATVKKQLGGGESTIEEVLALAEDERAVARMKVVELLQALPGIGTVRAQHALELLKIAPNRRLRGLGVRQRRALSQWVERREKPED